MKAVEIYDVSRCIMIEQRRISPTYMLPSLLYLMLGSPRSLHLLPCSSAGVNVPLIGIGLRIPDIASVFYELLRLISKHMHTSREGTFLS